MRKEENLEMEKKAHKQLKSESDDTDFEALKESLQQPNAACAAWLA